MRVLKWLVGVIVLLILGLVGVGLFLPDTAHLERSVVIQSRPATVYTVLNGFRQFNKWSPWAGLDPDAVYVIEGPLVGVGAKQSWRSEDPGVGAGSQEIVEVTPYSQIRMKLVFDGFDSENYASYTLTPEGEGTRVVWSYDSTFDGDLLGRYFGLMLDRMLGSVYETGLASLKTLVESLPDDDVSDLDVEIVELDAQPIVYLSASAGPEDAADMLRAAYDKLSAHLSANGLGEAAPPIAITRAYDEETGGWRFDAARIVDRSDPPNAPAQGIEAGSTYAGPAIRATHVGPSEQSTATYRSLIAWRKIAGFEDNGDSWEQYVSNPETTPSDELRTLIFWPIK